MIFFDKKRTLYALIIWFTVILLFIFMGIPIIYEWHNKKISPFFILSVTQQDNLVHVFADGEILSWSIVQQIDYNNKKINFSFENTNNKIKSSYEFPLNWLIGYEMCYQNKYWEYCFWKTK